MDYERLLAIANRARSGTALSRDDRAFIRDDVPNELATFPSIEQPATLAHPGGFRVRGLPAGEWRTSGFKNERGVDVSFSVPIGGVVRVDLAR